MNAKKGISHEIQIFSHGKCRMGNELSKNSVAVDNKLNNDFLSLFDCVYCEMKPFLYYSRKKRRKSFLYQNMLHATIRSMIMHKILCTANQLVSTMISEMH